MPRRESRTEAEVRLAREAFCAARRSVDRLERWVAWYALRAVLERWDEQPDGPERTGAYIILAEAERHRRGGRLPESFHEANGRIRARIRDGRLRGPAVGL